MRRLSFRTHPFLRSLLTVVFGAVVIWPIIATAPETYVAVESRRGPIKVMPGQVWDRGGRLVIRHDPGGRVLDRMAQADRLLRDGITVAVMGTCASACTIYLANPRTCTSPQATWTFHPITPHPDHPTRAFGKHDPVLAAVTRSWLSRFPPDLADWVAATYETMEPGESVVLRGADFIAAGWLEACRETEDQSIPLSKPPVPLPRRP